jgi:hypothetical protein
MEGASKLASANGGIVPFIYVTKAQAHTYLIESKAPFIGSGLNPIMFSIKTTTSSRERRYQTKSVATTLIRFFYAKRRLQAWRFLWRKLSKNTSESSMVTCGMVSDLVDQTNAKPRRPCIKFGFLHAQVFFLCWKTAC